MLKARIPSDVTHGNLSRTCAVVLSRSGAPRLVVERNPRCACSSGLWPGEWWRGRNVAQAQAAEIYIEVRSIKIGDKRKDRSRGSWNVSRTFLGLATISWSTRTLAHTLPHSPLATLAYTLYTVLSISLCLHGYIYLQRHQSPRNRIKGMWELSPGFPAPRPAGAGALACLTG